MQCKTISGPLFLLRRRHKPLCPQAFSRIHQATLQNGTLTATEALVKNTLLLSAVLVLLIAAAGCSKSDSADQNPAPNTNAAAQNAKESATQAWQDTKSAATNAWNATKDEATNVWSKTTNAIH
jgi:hypothetical protein